MGQFRHEQGDYEGYRTVEAPAAIEASVFGVSQEGEGVNKYVFPRSRTYARRNEIAKVRHWIADKQQQRLRIDSEIQMANDWITDETLKMIKHRAFGKKRGPYAKKSQ